MKTQEKAIPSLGQLLRTLIKAGGYRHLLFNEGKDKDLDDLAAEDKSRQSSACEVMQSIQDTCNKALAEDLGCEWAQFFRQAWFHTRETMQELVQQVDVSPFSPNLGRELFRQQFVIPMISGFVQLITHRYKGGDAQAWLDSPFQTWLALAASQSGISKRVLLDNLANELDVDQRTVDRWLSGEAIGKLSWPYAEKTRAILGKKVVDHDVQVLSGWLLFACAIQSASPEIRAAAQRNSALNKQQSWSLEDDISKTHQNNSQASHSKTRKKLALITDEVHDFFSVKPRNDNALRTLLEQFKQLIEVAPPALQSSYQYIHDWLSARHAAVLGEKETALRLYACAVSGAWWRAGPNQHPILDEALVYAVGVGDKDAANAYWDKTFMLGLNHGPKRPLDKQETRRLAFAFEQRFHPQKAKDRIPPPVEFKSPEATFNLGRKHLANPNQKTKYAEGRTRRTPLMVAIQEGTLDEVKQLIAAGGDPNDFIPESGEGALSYAMRRACDRKDSIIMDYLLELDLTKATVNRPASTKRETPLQIAIEMANSHAVSRLIEHGADVEAACDHLPSALCYAMALFHGSLHRDDATQQDAYFAGETRADVFDAKKGAALDVDLARYREQSRILQNASEQNQRMVKAVFDYFIRPPEDHRKVILALLSGGADANRRYRVKARDLAEWTPTLFAAQVGDLAIFKVLVEYEGRNCGDPMLTLMPSSSLDRFDALWVAIDHGRHAIVSYLRERYWPAP